MAALDCCCSLKRQALQKRETEGQGLAGGADELEVSTQPVHLAVDRLPEFLADTAAYPCLFICGRCSSKSKDAAVQKQRDQPGQVLTQAGSQP